MHGSDVNVPVILLFVLQLHNVQGKLAKWQAMPRSGMERKAVQQEIEEDCQSLEYMVRWWAPC